MNPSPRFCTKCGQTLSPNARFCAKCGALVSQSPSPSPPPAAQHPPPRQRVERTEFVPPQPEVIPAPDWDYDDGGSSSSGRPNWMVLLTGGMAGALLVCCLAVGAFWAYPRYFGEATDTPTDTPATETAETTETSLAEITPGEPSVTEPAPPEEPPPGETPLEEPPPAEPPPGEPPPGEPPPSVVYDNVSFSNEPVLASQVIPKTVPAQTDPNAAPWEIAPEHITFKLDGYPLYPDAFHKPKIYVYPANEFAALNSSAAQTIADLEHFLERRPPDLGPDESIPFLPVFNAAQMMQAKIEYLDFQNGNGVRFLTQYGQSYYPINSRDMFYTFQGLTHDRRFYIAAVLPVANPVLPEPETVTMDDNFFNNYTPYVQDIEALLGGQPPDSFSPNLLLLDEMMRTFLVQ